jgi:hypothetical protein
LIAEITAFDLTDFKRFGLPGHLPA